MPAYYGSVKDPETGRVSVGVILEDLCVPNAVLAPKLDDDAVLLTVEHVARLHAAFWNSPELASGALGIKSHAHPWYQPGWRDDLRAYWPTFEAKWKARAGALPDKAYEAGRAIVADFNWVQTSLSSKPHTFNHGDVKV